jgi:hypothetical protein
MSVQTTARKFVELCNQGKNFDVMRTMYAPGAMKPGRGRFCSRFLSPGLPRAQLFYPEPQPASSV